MATKSMRRGRRARRGEGGGLLVLSVSIVVIFIILATPFIIFLADLSAQLTAMADAEHIAKQAAGVVDDHRFWLEAPRPGFNEAKAVEIASSAATAMCQRSRMHLDTISISGVTNNDGSQSTICTVNVDARARIPFLFAVGQFDMRGYFSGKIAATGKTEHSNPLVYSILHMDAPTTGIDESHKRPLGFNQRDVVVLPTYGNFYTAVAGVTTNPTPYGKGLAPNLAPENFFAMNHYHFKKSDFEYVVATGKDVTNNAWHVKRLIDGVWYEVPH